MEKKIDKLTLETVNYCFAIKWHDFGLDLILIGVFFSFFSFLPKSLLDHWRRKYFATLKVGFH